MLKNLFKVIYKVTEQGLEIIRSLTKQQLLSEVLGCLWAKEIYNQGYIFHEERCSLSNFAFPTIFTIVHFTI